MLDGVVDAVNGIRCCDLGGVYNKMSEFFKQIRELGEEFLETIQHKTKLSTIFDIFLEKVIPTFVSEKELKEYYERRMEEVNDFIDKL
ncbi:MAG: hypothetical protein ACFFEN_15140 [Candidatus Thorarchaeota archaeon]